MSELKPCPVTQIQAYRAYEKLLEIMEDETDDQTEVFSTAYKALYWIANGRRAQLAESKRRERAAVEDIHTVYSDGLCEVCGRRDTCLMTLDRGEDGTVCHGIGFEWRGPQEAGEGERNE